MRTSIPTLPACSGRVSQTSLVELMLAEHAAAVALAARLHENEAYAPPLLRKVFHNAVTYQVGQRNFRGRNQVVI